MMRNSWHADVLSDVLDVPRRALTLLVRGYRLLLRPMLGNRCRYEPSCSVYALEALQVHGAAAGSLLAAYRVVRCNPWCAGGHDPVPAQSSRLFHFLSARVRNADDVSVASTSSDSGGALNVDAVHPTSTQSRSKNSL